MKVRLYALLGICVAILIVSGPDTQGKKPEKPVKPGITEIEWITFTGDLEGDQEVEGLCCVPGRYPPYSMKLKFDVGDELAGPLYIPAGTWINGHLWINTYGTGQNREYIVHFWTDDFGIEIIGGVIDYDRKNKIETVTFTEEECLLCEKLELDTATGVPTGECFDPWISFDVSFTLVREPY